MLVVTAMATVMSAVMVSAAPAANSDTPLAPPPAPVLVTSLVKQDNTASSLVDSQDTGSLFVKRDTDLLTFSTSFSCDRPGIFAVQDTGCRVFHFCQDDGRMDSFFCPNLTLFNQRFFVCDWSYNVDCSVAHEFYHLNDGLYLTSPEQISHAISPAIRISQPDELLTGSASSLHTSPGLSLTSNSLGPASEVRQGKSLTPLASPPAPVTQVQTVTSSDPAYPGDVASVYYGDVADPEPASVYSDAVADPEPAGYYTAPSSGLTTYDDAVADPEPQAYYDAIADPEPYGYPGGLGYDASDPEPAPAAPVLAVAA